MPADLESHTILDNATPSTDDRSDSAATDTAQVADGLLTLLAPVVQEMDSRVVAVRKSQMALSSEIERLTAELQLFLNTSEPPPLQPAIQKLVGARRRLMAANHTLKQVQDRVERMYTGISKDTIGKV